MVLVFSAILVVPVSNTPIYALEVTIEKHRLWSRLRIDASKVQRTLEWWKMVDRLAVEARKVIRPRGTFRFFGIRQIRPDSVLLDEEIELQNLRQARLFAGAERIALCAVTLGGELESLCNTMALGGDYPEASVLSVIGDCALAEGQSKLQAAALKEMGDKQLTTGVVLQPGARYWDLQVNLVFRKTLPLDAIGIQILDSFALRPSKSKTFACVFTRNPGRPDSKEIGS